jgi:hypothetical protein
MQRVGGGRPLLSFLDGGDLAGVKSEFSFVARGEADFGGDGDGFDFGLAGVFVELALVVPDDELADVVLQEERIVHIYY